MLEMFASLSVVEKTDTLLINKLHFTGDLDETTAQIVHIARQTRAAFLS